MRSVEVVVVGAGPAGAATAILLTERGHRVVLLDRARFPRDKVCGEYLSPEASRILDRLGVLAAVEASGARTLRGMRLCAPDGTVLVADYPTTSPWRGYRDHALAVRRRALDAILVARAHALGVDVREGVRVTDVLVEGGRVRGVEAVATLTGHGAAPGATLTLHAPVVVGADGRASVVARRLGRVRPHRWLARLALVTDVEGEPPDGERGHIVVAPPVYAILNPVGERLMTLSLVVPATEGPRLRGDLAGYLERQVRALPELAARLAGTRRVAPVRALGPLAYRVTPPRHAGAVLVGDALGFLDPFTGEGVYAALRSAEQASAVIARALDQGDLSTRALGAGHRRHRAEGRAKARVCLLLQHVIARRWLATRVARALARRPAQLATLMGVIGDFVPAGQALSPPFLLRLLRRGP